MPQPTHPPKLPITQEELNFYDCDLEANESWQKFYDYEYGPINDDDLIPVRRIK